MVTLRKAYLKVWTSKVTVSVPILTMGLALATLKWPALYPVYLSLTVIWIFHATFFQSNWKRSTKRILKNWVSWHGMSGTFGFILDSFFWHALAAVYFESWNDLPLVIKDISDILTDFFFFFVSKHDYPTQPQNKSGSAWCFIRACSSSSYSVF